MTDFKFKTGDVVKIISCSDQAYWYSNRIGETFTVTESAPGVGTHGKRYRAEGLYSAGYVLEKDLQLLEAVVTDRMTSFNPSRLTLPQLRAALDHFQAEIAVLEAKKELIHATFREHGFTLAGEEAERLDVQPAEPEKLNMRDVWLKNDLQPKAAFIYQGPEKAYLTIGRVYAVRRLDNSDSEYPVSITDNTDAEYWLDQVAMDQFVGV